ncbi:MAG: amidohydrolase family protein [bacterium]|nr:amidohydrolase family protein [bacterium]
MPDPRIVNVHEHLMDNQRAWADLESVNRRTGVAATVLVASPRYTFTLRKGTGFVNHHENNAFLCRVAREHPGRYFAYVTFHPNDDDLVGRLDRYLADGASGVKLYLGHGAEVGDGEPFHVYPLDDPRILPLYAFCQERQVPIIFHINLRKYEAEARRIFDAYPDLPFIVPHFGLWSGDDRRYKLDKLLEEYPKLMTDISFGWWYSVEGLERISQRPEPAWAMPKEKKKTQPLPFRDFVLKHQDRIMFGTDVVITGHKSKNADALTDFWLSYRAMLELEEYDFRDRKGKDYHFNGLALPPKVVTKIYRGNWERLMQRIGRPVQTADTAGAADGAATGEAQPTTAKVPLSARLLPNPRIVNAHEHLMDHKRGRANFIEANRRVGIAATCLVASSRFTLYGGEAGFTEHHTNNRYLCDLARKNPGLYYAFVTFHPDDEDIVGQLQEYLATGAMGVKLYVGHGGKTGDGKPFHTCALDDPKLLPLYAYCQAHRVPIIFHINMYRFQEEAERVFDRYPDLRVILPHFGLLANHLPRLDRLLTDHPKLLVDISFGYYKYHRNGLRRISRTADAFRELVIKHQDRILFGSDVVITGNKTKTADFLTDSFMTYRCMLELEEYDFRIREYDEHYNGLHLPEAVVRKIYRGNWLRLLETLRTSGTTQSGG